MSLRCSPTIAPSSRRQRHATCVRAGLLVASAVLIGPPDLAAAQQVHEGFDTFAWTLSGHPDGSGSQDDATMTVVGPDDAPCDPQGAWFEAVSPASGTLAVDVDFVNTDLWAPAHPIFDAPAWIRNGEIITVPPVAPGPTGGWPSGRYQSNSSFSPASRSAWVSGRPTVSRVRASPPSPT